MKLGHFENAAKSGAFSKQCSFIGPVMVKLHRFENVYVVWCKIGSLAKNEHGEPRMEYRACLYNHN